MTHSHRNPHRLHIGCDACLHRVRVDQYRTEVAAMSIDQLVEALAGRDHTHTDWRHRILTAELNTRPRWADDAASV